MHAAAGGVGSLLVQLAANAGAHVIAAAGGSRKLLVARDLGADRMIDYAPRGLGGKRPIEPGGRRLRRRRRGDRPGGAGAAAWRAGGFVALRRRRWPFSSVPEEARSGRWRGPDPAATRAATSLALAEAAAGRLRPLIGRRSRFAARPRPTPRSRRARRSARRCSPCENLRGERVRPHPERAAQRPAPAMAPMPSCPGRRACMVFLRLRQRGDVAHAAARARRLARTRGGARPSTSETWDTPRCAPRRRRSEKPVEAPKVSDRARARCASSSCPRW